MNKLGKKFAICLLALLCALTFAACGDNNSELNNGESIVVGNGTQKDPYIITTVEQLTKFSENAIDTDFKNTFFQLGADIDLNGNEWAPIGRGYDFNGTFDGKGFTISNFKITNTYQASGLFGSNAGIIKNLNVTNFKISTNYTTNSKETAAFAGGIVAYNKGEIIDCFANGNVILVSSYISYAGILAGYNIAQSKIENCGAIGGVSSRSSRMPSAGGLVGYNSGTIGNCYVDSAVMTTTNYGISVSNCGGFVGNNAGTIDNGFSMSSLVATATDGFIDFRAGGFTGNNSGTILSCIAAGEVHASFAYHDTPSVGGFAGENSGILSNIYRHEEQLIIWEEDNGDIKHQDGTNQDGELCSTINLNDETFYKNNLNWSETIWELSSLSFENCIYPTLK